MNKYTREEVRKEALKYFNGDSLATDVWINKYSLKDSEGNIYELTPKDMHKRIASELARIENKYPNPLSEQKILELIEDFKYIVPQGGPMSGIGNNLQTVSLSNCFVVGNTSDSYGGLMLTDQEQVQLMKRRGGCIEENTFVFLKDKGHVKIKDVQVGDYILSLNDKNNETEFKLITDKFISEVNLDEQIKVKYKNGTELRTSSKHPITTITNDGIKYLSLDDGLNINNVGIKPNNNESSIYNYDENLSKIGWFLGAHTGDGTSDKPQNKFNRLRINGDNKSVIDEYAAIANELSNSNNNVFIDNRKDYSSDVWKYTQKNKNTSNIINDYFDGKFGKKVYDGDVYSFIEENNLWIPYIAGLIDTDGSVKSSGSIEIAICMSKVIDKLCIILSSNNIDFHFKKKIDKRIKNKLVYRLTIYRRNELCNHILKYIKHDIKKNKLMNTEIYENEKHKKYSSLFFITNNEYNNIIDSYNKTHNNTNNLVKIISLLKKYKKLGIGGLIELLNNNLITNDIYNNITNRIYIDDIIFEDDVKLNYLDINVEDNHNYFAGNFGLINIHNCGHDLSHIRPKGSPVKNSALTSTGVVPFMERFSNSTREVAQDGRRGALMLSLSVKNMDAEDFIDAKMEQGKVTGANISIKLTDEFMNCVVNGTPFTQQYPIDSDTPIYTKEIDAQKLWKKIIHNAWKSAEPGLLFWDTIIREAIPDCYPEHGFTSVSTNPCAEIPLCENDSCRLIAINLYSYVENPFTTEAKFNFDLFEEHVIAAQRFMDDVVDLEIEKIDAILTKIKTDPEPEHIKRVENDLWIKIREKAVQGRRTGLGITSEGDMLAALGLIYGTDEATEFAVKVHKMLAVSAYKSSIIMAKERGSFEVFKFDSEKNNPFVQRIMGELSEEYIDMWKNTGRRNIALLTSAPTGSVSILTQTTSGIEPCFLPFYTRRRKINPNDKNATVSFKDEVGDSWEEYNVFHPKFKIWAEINGYVDIEKMKEVDLNKIVKLSPYYKATSNDVNWVNKVKMQGEIQKWVDHSISVTVNLPENTTEEIVSKVYQTGWESGCKGITIYRDGSRSGVLISKKEKKTNIFTENDAPKRPKSLPCDIIRFTNKGEKWIGFLGLLENRPYEVFTGLQESVNIPNYVVSAEIIKEKGAETDGHSRYDLKWIDKDGYQQVFVGLSRAFNREYWNLGRMVSGLLRHGMPLPNLMTLIDKLDMGESESIASWKNGVKRMIKKYVVDGTKVKGQECPICHSTHLVYKEGCVTCLECNWSKCD